MKRVHPQSSHLLTFFPIYMGMPRVMTGTAMPATSEITIGAPSTMPSCQRIFRVRDQGFFPQKVQPEGLRRRQELESVMMEEKYGRAT